MLPQGNATFAGFVVARDAPAPQASGWVSATRELRSVSTDRRSLPKAVARVVPQGPERSHPIGFA